MAFWQITYGGVTQDAAAWGISGLKRKRQTPVDTDIVSFRLESAPFDGSLPFAYLQPLSILRNGVPWFSGIVTKPMPKGKARGESIDYQISGPWYWLEKTVFQQQWVSVDTSGGGTVTGTTTQSETILGQSLDGTKMNSGDVLREVLIYAQYAYQMIPFPSTVDVSHLPPAPSTSAPFIIGTITPSITVPYMTVRDKSCADIIRQMMKYSPDAVAWFDYSTSPPTLNIGQRSGLQNQRITLFPQPGDGQPKLASAFNPTPRYDLQVPCVVAKFLQSNSDNGTTYASTIVQVYPPAPAGVDPGAWASQPRAWVQTIDLVGGHTTQQTASLNTKARPIAAADTIAIFWALRKQPQLTATKNPPYVDVGAPIYDTANMKVAFLNTTIDPDDILGQAPQAINNPNNVTIGGAAPPGDCVQLTSELLPGGFPDWLQESEHLDKAKVTIEVHLSYDTSMGTDAATKALFWQDPADPTKVITDGTGVYIFYWSGLVTNAETQTYSELTSWSAREPVPDGFAEALYNSLKDLHFEGELTMIEQECSDVLPCGCVFNTADGNPDWQAANMLVLSVDEDIDTGTTTVNFGPPAFLNLDEMEKLFRANLGVLPSYKLDQRTSGKLAAGSNIIGADHSADTHVVNPASPPATFVTPFQVTTGGSADAPTAKVRLQSSLLRSLVQNDTQTITGLDTPIPYQPGNDFFYLEITLDGAGNTTAATIKNWHTGGTWLPGDLPGEYGSGHGPFEYQLTYDANSNKIFTQYIARIGIWTSTFNGPTVVNTQLLTQNLLMQGDTYSGALFTTEDGPATIGIVSPKPYTSSS